jgi:hypothetical protein
MLTLKYPYIKSRRQVKDLQHIALTHGPLTEYLKEATGEKRREVGHEGLTSPNPRQFSTLVLSSQF